MSSTATKPLSKPPRLAKAKVSTANASAAKPATRLRRMPPKELIRFCRGMASMLRARLTTADALMFYGEGHSNSLVKSGLAGIRKEIESGAPAYIGFKKSGLFDDKVVGLIKAGSDAGQLHKAFAAIGERLRIERAFAAKMKKATLIPCMVICALIGIFIVAQCKVVPQIEGMLNDFKAEPDAFSAIVFKVSHVTRKVWPVFVLLLGGSVALVVFVRPVRDVVLALLMSKIKLLRDLIMGMRQMAFLGSLNMLHANGITLAKSIETAAESVKNTPMFDELIDAGKRYKETGLPFSEAIKKFTSCDPQVSHMIGIGEKSSSLVDQLDLLVEMYEEDTAATVETFAALVNLLTLIIAGVLITFVFVGAFLPVFLMGPKMMKAAG
jgi:type II secretory pathway component PulF